ncbi:amidohydrolase family protein [candidate division KSB1 bacterium]
MPIIDFHNHFYPPEYLDAINNGPSNIKVTFDEEGNPLLHYPGDYNICVPGHRDIKYREEVLEEAGIDKQIITLTSPGTDIEEPGRAVELAQLVNDCFTKIREEKSGSFSALATLPLINPKASVKELERAVNELGFRGVMFFSNVQGVGLDDERFWPIYERADELGIVIYIHPIDPVGVEAMTDYWLMPLIGFTFDTTLAAAKLVFSGVAKRFPNINWVLGHLGGAIPYLAERLDRGFYAFKECRQHIEKVPGEYLKEFYYDTVNFDIKALELAIEFAGTDHLLAGSDYPHQIGSLGKMIESIGKLEISEDAKQSIYGGNAERLLAL